MTLLIPQVPGTSSKDTLRTQLLLWQRWLQWAVQALQVLSEVGVSPGYTALTLRLLAMYCLRQLPLLWLLTSTRQREEALQHSRLRW